MANKIEQITPYLNYTCYFCILGLFEINSSTGQIINRGSLSGHAGEYRLTVQAQDRGFPYLQGSALAVITVTPSNSDPPIWQNPNPDVVTSMTVHVLEVINYHQLI